MEAESGVRVVVDAAGVRVTCRRQVGLTIECYTTLAYGHSPGADDVAAELLTLVQAVADDAEAILRDVVAARQ